MTKSPLKILTVIVAMLCGHGIAWSQCIVYNESYKGSYAGTSSASYSGMGYSLVGPMQSMNDGLFRAPVVSFYIYTGKYKSNGTTVTYKDFEYYPDTPINGNPSSGGLLIALVKQGKTYKILATKKDVFDSDTISGTATWKPLPGWSGGSTWYAPTLASTVSAWYPEDTNDPRPIGTTNNGSGPVKVYKTISSNSYILNAQLTSGVSNLDFNQAFDRAKQYFISQGYTDRIANPYR